MGWRKQRRHGSPRLQIAIGGKGAQALKEITVRAEVRQIRTVAEDSNRISSDEFETSGVYSADGFEDNDESIDEGVSFTDLLVELPNLPMQSFDGALSKQRPVIAYIPSLEVKNNELVYNAIHPIMIDMNNAHAFNLNRVQVRLLTSSSSTVAIEGASIVVVLS